MITEEELVRVNEINKEIHEIDSLIGFKIKRVSSIDSRLYQGYSNIELSDNISKLFTDTMKDKLLEYKDKLMLEYNMIICPSEPNSLSQS